jgi:hypothetical protein
MKTILIHGLASHRSHALDQVNGNHIPHLRLKFLLFHQFQVLSQRLSYNVKVLISTLLTSGNLYRDKKKVKAQKTMHIHLIF